MKNYDLMRPKTEYEEVIARRESDGKFFYSKYHDQFLTTPCPACNSEGIFTFFKFGFSHNICPRCRTLYCSPRPGEDLLNDYYSSYDAPRLWTKLLLQADQSRKRLQYMPRVNRIISCLKKAGAGGQVRVLDAGAGSGAFAACLRDSGFFTEVVALDIADSCITACKKSGLLTMQGTLADLQPETYDLITMNDLIEHVFSPRDLLLQCHQALTEDGFVVIATPNGDGFDFKILRERTGNITPPEHLNYFNPKSLSLLLTDCGFTPLLVETPGLLDVDMVQKERERGYPVDAANEYIGFIMDQDEKVRQNFQDFLARSLLSSHMIIIARKQT